MFNKSNILVIFISILLGCTSENKNSSAEINTLGSYKDSLLIDKQNEIDSFKNSEMDEVMREYGTYIKKYSKRYGFDWRLILAIIKVESGFYINLESPRGALGLMQIMPSTADHLADELDLEEVVSPKNNIAAGIYLLWKIFSIYEKANEIDQMKITLAAYNCGIGRIKDAQDIVMYQGGNRNSWSEIASALKFLTNKQSELHSKVWDRQRPSNGYFNDYQQPISYVENVLHEFERMKIKLSYN